MTAASGTSAPAEVDLVGIGFGPANLALAVALAEGEGTEGRPTTGERTPSAAAGRAAPTMLYCERQPEFGWHRGMLIDEATMQVSFLKDLATMRDPKSSYTFVSYLHAVGRLPEFVNSKALYPLRVEFHDYLRWAADRLGEHVRYDTEVVGLEPVTTGGVITAVDVLARERGGPARAVARARNVVFGTGLTPYLPPEVRASDRVIHSSALLHRAARLDPASESIVIVGAGQSAAEAADYLYSAFPDADIHTVFSRYGYSVADDSPFANRIFDPTAVDEFFHAPEAVKERLLGYHANTNYAVVDLESAQRLHAKLYRERIGGRRRLHIANMSRISAIQPDASGVRVHIEATNTGAVRTLRADLVVFATGYRPSDPAPLLGPLSAECKRGHDGRIVIDRGYRVETSESVACRVFIHGPYAEHSHGLSAGLLSNVATRAGEIVHGLRTR